MHGIEALRYPKINNLLGVTCYLQGDLPQAVSFLKQAAEGGDRHACYNLAMVYIAGGAKAAAKKILAEIEKRPGFVQDPSSCERFLPIFNC